MRDRAAAAGGVLRLESRADGGARILVEIPWPPAS